MPAQVLTSTENNFTRGLITEATGLNFPENAATQTDNCVYTLIGDVTRRQGIAQEVNGTANNISVTNQSINTYKWNNVGGDGLTQVVVEQVGGTLYFYHSSTATNASPLSTQLLVSTVSLSSFVATGNTLDVSLECQFADGNGYLFVFHPQCDSFYCTYTSGTITGAPIGIQIRDFAGIFESLPVNTRPTSLSNEHLYNLINQGWTNGSPWTAFSSSLINPISTGVKAFIVQTGLPVSLGDNILIENNHQAAPGGVFQTSGNIVMSGTVTGYSVDILTVNVTYANPTWIGSGYGDWIMFPTNHGYITTWNTSEGNYPSNADVWWYFKDTSDAFNPATTQPNVDLSSGNAPKGSFLLNPWRQTRSAVSTIAGLTDVITNVRPRTGCWFQGRVWYTGVDDSFAATGDAIFTTWTENIYFSQIVQTSADFGKCYQVNDPTSENLFDLLPTDGGVITIQGSGSIYRLFPIQNALLVFAANGVYYISGSQGTGFSANNYTVTELSKIRSISSTSFVSINGWPMFWNEEGIYQVSPASDGQNAQNQVRTNQIQVTPITVGTIQTFYDDIPLSSKLYARGAYDPIEYVVQWVYRDTDAPDVTGRYTYNKILNYNTYNKAFYPYTVDISTAHIMGVVYVSSPGGSAAPDSSIKYFYSDNSGVSFADIHDTTYVDWGSVNYESSFTTGFKLRGQGIKKFQPMYLQVYCRTNGTNYGYKLQSIWDYSNSRSSGRWSSVQEFQNSQFDIYDTVFRRHRIRGSGYSVQFKFISIDGVAFSIQGWAVADTANASV